MTPTQKKFRKEMKKIKKEYGIEDEDEDDKVKWGNPTAKRKISIVSIIFIIWNIYAISTWVVPLISKLPTSPSNVTQIDNSNNSQKDISDYIQDTSKIDLELNIILEKINENNQGKPYTKEDILTDRDALEDLRERVKLPSTITTDSEVNEFSLIEYSYTEQIALTKNILYAIYQGKPDNINTMYNKINESKEKIREEIIGILEKNKMEYKIKEDGTIEYKYRI